MSFHDILATGYKRLALNNQHGRPILMCALGASGRWSRKMRRVRVLVDRRRCLTRLGMILPPFARKRGTSPSEGSTSSGRTAICGIYYENALQDVMPCCTGYVGVGLSEFSVFHTRIARCRATASRLETSIYGRCAGRCAMIVWGHPPNHLPR